MGNVASALAAPAAAVRRQDALPASVRLDRVRELQRRIDQLQAPTVTVPTLPTLPALADLLPGGGLRPGAAYSVHGSATLIMALMAGPVGAGAWAGVVGMPEFGAEAAAGLGLDLGRVVLVPHPGEHWLTVTAALADALGVVVVRPAGRVTDAAADRLAARLRSRESVLLALGDWPQSEARLGVSGPSWEGIGAGHGHLAARQLTVTVASRSGRPRSRRLWLPDPSQRVRSGEQPMVGLAVRAS